MTLFDNKYQLSSCELNFYYNELINDKFSVWDNVYQEPQWVLDFSKNEFGNKYLDPQLIWEMILDGSIDELTYSVGMIDSKYEKYKFHPKSKAVYFPILIDINDDIQGIVCGIIQQIHDIYYENTKIIAKSGILLTCDYFDTNKVINEDIDPNCCFITGHLFIEFQ